MASLQLWRLGAVPATSEQPCCDFSRGTIGASGEYQRIGQRSFYIQYIQKQPKEKDKDKKGQLRPLDQRTTALFLCLPTVQIRLPGGGNTASYIPGCARNGAQLLHMRQQDWKRAPVLAAEGKASNCRPRRAAHYITLPFPRLNKVSRGRRLA